MANFIFGAIKKNLGGKVEIIITGSAPIKKEILDYLKVGFNVNVLEAYGLTETCGPTTVTRKVNSLSGHVGFVVDGICVKLLEHKELN